MLRIYIIGLVILIFAIIINSLIGKISLITWYDFGPSVLDHGFSAFKKAGVLNCFWLLVIYPFLLGAAYFIGEKIYNLF